MNDCVIDTPIGHLRLSSDEIGICGLDHTSGPVCGTEDPVLLEAVRQLKEYFSGSRKAFDLPLHLVGTPFQLKCWQALQKIPYGETRTYGEQAAAIGKPSACRAVGGANHRNPVMIIVPCHRVIGADGSLTGFGGGLDMKAWLLQHEQMHINRK